MKQFLLLSLAALSMAACAEKMTDSGSGDGNEEFEKSFISVNLKTDDASTRSEDSNEFEEGETEESFVGNVNFFLFKSDGNAFPVNGVSGRNYKTIKLENGMREGQILSFSNQKGEYPAYIVAVLNMDERTIQPSYSLQNLYNTLAPIRNASNNFIMSNSVYADMEGNIINATALEEENIRQSEEDAMENPVQIYVERISAKVELVAKGDVAGKDATYDTGVSIEGSPIYVKVLNWELFNDYNQSIVLKHIYPEEWGMTDKIGFLWNDPNRFRSYWAASYTGAFPEGNTFNWSEGLEPGDVTYCGENTRKVEVDADDNVISDPRAKVIIKGQLVNVEGQPLEMISWQDRLYKENSAVLNAVASLVSSQIFYKEGEEYKCITKDDIKIMFGTGAPEELGVKAFEAYFQLADASQSKNWYTYSSVNGYETAGADDVNEILADVEPALMYKDGMTYYYTDIRHSGSTGSDSEFGVVRNHIYRVNITDISGLGTSVTDPDVDIDEPEHPQEAETFVSAEVRILSWRVVNNDYSVK